MELKGLPTGVEALEVRVPAIGDLVFFHGMIIPVDDEHVPIYSAELIVGLLPGYERVYDINTDVFSIVKTKK